MFRIETIVSQFANVHDSTFGIWYFHEICYIVPANFACIQKFLGATSLSKALAKQQGVYAYLTRYTLYQDCEEAVKCAVFRFFGCEVH